MTHPKRHCRGHWYHCDKCNKLSKHVLVAQGQTPPKRSVCASCGGSSSYHSSVIPTQEE